jgi:hypothetical protein
MVGGEFVHEDDRRARAGFLVMQANATEITPDAFSRD